MTADVAPRGKRIVAWKGLGGSAEGNMEDDVKDGERGRRRSNNMWDHG